MMSDRQTSFPGQMLLRVFACQEVVFGCFVVWTRRDNLGYQAWKDTHMRGYALGSGMIIFGQVIWILSYGQKQPPTPGIVIFKILLCVGGMFHGTMALQDGNGNFMPIVVLIYVITGLFWCFSLLRLSSTRSARLAQMSQSEMEAARELQSGVSFQVPAAINRPQHRW
eukprot:TRINITY_DN13940_c0_g1_i1.p1 TRINITY_DN13940_c0_g1~~TRINITY_DN13940_c0_g1_i1.p1  ORF type:complete len:192 (+),score=3.58 TRINITY_DN13940_c0_g1_i1:75-578(+)